MKEEGNIEDRHLLPVDGLKRADDVKAQFVRIFVSEAWRASVAGQLLTACLINLLCRQAKLVGHVEIVTPATPLLIILPSGVASRHFPACLEDLATWAAAGAVTVSVGKSDAVADQTILIGDVGEGSFAICALTAIGDGWRAWVGHPSAAPAAIHPRSANPLGPFLAAALAAGEVFKRTCGVTRGRFLMANGYSLWSGRSCDKWDSLDDGPDIAGRALAPFHLIGAGAVGNGLAFVLAYLGLRDSYVVTIDDDRYDKRNLNRCLCAGWDDLKHAKVGALARFLRSGGVAAYPFPGTVKAYLGDVRRGLCADVARRVDDLDFGTVASCVDKGISRQDIQSLRPRILVGGSTLDLQAKSNIYNRRPGDACLACYNPAERDGERIRQLEGALLAMPPAERAAYLHEHNLDSNAVEAYLSGAECGGVGEIALKALATRPPAQFSVGFVSLGAALLLASALLREALFSGVAPRRSDMTTLNFLNGGLLDAGLGFDPDCEWSCQARLHMVSSTSVAS